MINKTLEKKTTGIHRQLCKFWAFLVRAFLVWGLFGNQPFWKWAFMSRILTFDQIFNTLFQCEYLLDESNAEVIYLSNLFLDRGDSPCFQGLFPLFLLINAYCRKRNINFSYTFINASSTQNRTAGTCAVCSTKPEAVF